MTARNPDWRQPSGRCPLRMLVWAAVMSFTVAAAQAVTPDEMLTDPALETRAREISQQLRCVVCQNQSIDNFNAPLAHDLRILVRDRLKAGDSDAQTLDYIVARYGNFVLLKPPMQLNTLFLWFGPFLILLLAGYAFVRVVRRQETRQRQNGRRIDCRRAAAPKRPDKRRNFSMTLWIILTVMTALAAVAMAAPFLKQNGQRTCNRRISMCIATSSKRSSEKKSQD